MTSTIAWLPSSFFLLSVPRRDRFLFLFFFLVSFFSLSPLILWFVFMILFFID